MKHQCFVLPESLMIAIAEHWANGEHPSISHAITDLLLKGLGTIEETPAIRWAISEHENTTEERKWN